jgi:peptidoglycan hydrolase CwlO-like protein
MSTIEAMRLSLVELSKNGTAHFDTVAQQIRETRIALMLLEGEDINTYLNNIKRYNSELHKLRKQKNELKEEIAKLEQEIAKLNS